VTQPTRATSLMQAVSNHYAAQAASIENEVPGWWGEETQEDVARMVADPAYRDSLTGYRRRFLTNVREAAIERGFISAADFVPGFTGYPADDEAGEVSPGGDLTRPGQHGTMAHGTDGRRYMGGGTAV